MIFGLCVSSWSGWVARIEWLVILLLFIHLLVGVFRSIYTISKALGRELEDFIWNRLEDVVVRADRRSLDGTGKVRFGLQNEARELSKREWPWLCCVYTGEGPLRLTTRTSAKTSDPAQFGEVDRLGLSNSYQPSLISPAVPLSDFH